MTIIWSSACFPAAEFNPEDRYYFISNKQYKPNKVLSFNKNKHLILVKRNKNDSKQLWKFKRLKTGGYKMINKSTGDKLAVDSDKNNPQLRRKGNYSGQIWHVSTDKKGWYRMSNQFLTADNVIDVGSKKGQIVYFEKKSRNTHGSYWKFDPISEMVIDTAANHPNAYTAIFRNLGAKSVRVTRIERHNGEQGDGKSIVVNVRKSSEFENVVVGDLFSVQSLNTKGEVVDKYAHRSVIATVREKNYPILIYGNPRYDALSHVGSANELVSMDSNFLGVDMTDYRPLDISGSIAKKKIFETPMQHMTEYNITNGTQIIKAGFSMGTNNTGIGSTKTHMVHGSRAFSTSLSVGAGTKFPLGKAPATGEVDFSYKQKKSEKWSSTDIFTFSRESKVIYTVDVEPEKAYLADEFMQRVLGAKSDSDYDGIIRDYGTHYPASIQYGGRFVSYLKLKETQYALLKSKGFDIKAKVEQASKGIKKVDGKKTTSSSSGGNGGSLSVAWGESEKEKEIEKTTELRYIYTGGEGGFDSWSVPTGREVPVAASMVRLDTLITPRVFKNGESAVNLRKKQISIGMAVSRHLNNSHKLNSAPLPTRFVNVTLDSAKFTKVIDDANQNTRGRISLQFSNINEDKKDVYKEYFVESDDVFAREIGDTRKYNLYKHFWRSSDWSTNFKHGNNVVLSPNHLANKTISLGVKATGRDDKKFIYPNIKAELFVDIQEKDDCCGHERITKSVEFEVFPPKAKIVTKTKVEDYLIMDNGKHNKAEQGLATVMFKIERQPQEFDELSDTFK